MEEMKTLIEQERFSIISDEHRTFLIAFDVEMRKLGYEIYQVANAYTWAKNWINAKYMINYELTGTKPRKIAAHIFIKDDGLFLRLLVLKKAVFGSNAYKSRHSVIEPHRAYIENAPIHIKELFMKNDCDHSHEGQHGFCWRLDAYTIDGIVYEKCLGRGLDIWNPSMEQLPDYINMLSVVNSNYLSNYKRV